MKRVVNPAPAQQGSARHTGSDFAKFYRYLKRQRRLHGKPPGEHRSVTQQITLILEQPYSAVYAGTREKGFRTLSMADWHKLGLFYELTLDDIYQIVTEVPAVPGSQPQDGKEDVA